jgi:hypothetical protein
MVKSGLKHIKKNGLNNLKTNKIMKNIHTLPTDKPSRLYYWEDKLVLGNLATTPMNRSIYITNDEEIKYDDYYLGEDNHIYCLVTTVNYNGKKIILTTDQDLIKDGVQAIDDGFLEWFIKNPSCENVEVKKVKGRYRDFGGNVHNYINYRIIIPKEEPKQRLEKYSERFDNKDNELVEGVFNPENWGKRLVKEDADKDSFEDVTNYITEKMYSEEEVKQFGLYLGDNLKKLKDKTIDEIFEQYKYLQRNI